MTSKQSEDYFALKERKAKEQGKNFWFEAVLTDEEANVTTAHTCLSCKYLLALSSKCGLGHNPIPISTTTCDEWRYFA